MIDACYIGDVRDGLRSFIAAGVRAQTCVTSPPYWGLRDYGTAQWEGGDAGCDHRHQLGGEGPRSAIQNGSIGTQTHQYRDTCGKCGARRIDRQIGLEPTIAEYVATMVNVFRLVRDVLADDGTLWLNLGDSYYSNSSGQVKDSMRGVGSKHDFLGSTAVRPTMEPGARTKNLVGVPWRVAFALQADGWYLRSDIIWAKPNPMPESVTDRPTKSHEYLFLLAKSERYFYDAAAIAEEVTDSTVERLSQPTLDQQEGSWRVPGKTNGAMKAVGSAYSFARKVNEEPPPGQPNQHRSDREDIEYRGKRNRRTVWTVTTQPFSDAHFAVMPTALVEPCIMAGSRPGDVVLDPFMGSGTVAQVAQDLGRRWIGCELNGEYVKMQDRRTAQAGLDLRAAAD